METELHGVQHWEARGRMGFTKAKVQQRKEKGQGIRGGGSRELYLKSVPPKGLSETQKVTGSDAGSCPKESTAWSRGGEPGLVGSSWVGARIWQTTNGARKTGRRARTGSRFGTWVLRGEHGQEEREKAGSGQLGPRVEGQRQRAALHRSARWRSNGNRLPARDGPRRASVVPGPSLV